MYKTIAATYGKSPFSPSFLHTVLQEKQKYKIKLLIANLEKKSYFFCPALQKILLKIKQT